MRDFGGVAVTGWLLRVSPDKRKGRQGSREGRRENSPPRSFAPTFAASAFNPAARHFGVRRNHPEDNSEYVQGCDIASFDIYPVAHDSPVVAGNLWFVANGVGRLVKWAGPDRIVWNCIECTRIQNPKVKASPHQVRAEVWMSLIHGSRGLIYFVHEWQPRFNESALLSDPEMLTAVTAINQQITRLAPMLNRPALPGAVKVATDNREVPVAVTARERGGTTCIFAVGMRDGRATATFTMPGGKGEQLVEVMEENRTIVAKDGVFEDTFDPWAVHLYAVR